MCRATRGRNAETVAGTPEAAGVGDKNKTENKTGSTSKALLLNNKMDVE